MLFMFQGDMTPTNAGHKLQVLWDVLQANGVTRLAELQVSFLGWNDDNPVEVVGEDKRTIKPMLFAPASRNPDGSQYFRVPGTSIVQRSNDIEYNRKRGLSALLGDT